MEDWDFSSLVSVAIQDVNYNIYNIAVEMLRKKMREQPDDMLELNSINARHDIVRNLSKEILSQRRVQERYQKN